MSGVEVSVMLTWLSSDVEPMAGQCWLTVCWPNEISLVYWVATIGPQTTRERVSNPVSGGQCHPQEVLLAQFSLYVHKGWLNPIHFISFIIGQWRDNTCRPNTF